MLLNSEVSTCVQRSHNGTSDIHHFIVYWWVLSSVAQNPLNCNQEVKGAKPETARRSLGLDHDLSNNSILTEFLSLASLAHPPHEDLMLNNGMLVWR